MTADNAHSHRFRGLGTCRERSAYCLIRLRLPRPAIPAESACRPSGVCVGRGDHAVAPTPTAQEAMPPNSSWNGSPTAAKRD
jgi:hypothetical protein